MPTNAVIFYTHGSLCDRMAGAVFEDLECQGIVCSLSKNATVFQREVYTVLSCADYCLRTELQNVKICIGHCDIEGN
jgi:hypothetical protein